MRGRLIWQSIHFNPRAPRGARLEGSTGIMSVTTFQSTRPARGATFTFVGVSVTVTFQSTRPARGATSGRRVPPDGVVAFQSTRPARGATVSNCHIGAGHHISIHAPREGRDCTSGMPGYRLHISIHAPREGRDFVGLADRT